MAREQLVEERAALVEHLLVGHDKYAAMLLEGGCPTPEIMAIMFGLRENKLTLEDAERIERFVAENKVSGYEAAVSIYDSGGSEALEALLREDFDRVKFLSLPEDVQAAATLSQHHETLLNKENGEFIGVSLWDNYSKYDVLQQLFANVNNAESRERIENELISQGLSGQQLKDALTDIEHAATFFADQENVEFLHSLDNANDPNNMNNGRFTALDASLYVLSKTNGQQGKRNETVRKETLEHIARQQNVGSSHVLSLENGDLSETIDGFAVTAGGFTTHEREIFIESYIESRVERMLEGDVTARNELLVAVPTEITDARVVVSTLETQLKIAAEKSSKTETDFDVEMVIASKFLRDSVKLDALSGRSEFLEDKSTEDVQKLVLSLQLDRSTSGILDDYRSYAMEEALESLVDSAGVGGDFDDSAALFVQFAAIRTNYDIHSESSLSFIKRGRDLNGHYPSSKNARSNIAAVTSDALAILVAPGDADRQARHRERFAEQLQNPNFVLRDQSIDPADRAVLWDLWLMGVEDPESFENRFWEDTDWDNGIVNRDFAKALAEHQLLMRGESPETIAAHLKQIELIADTADGSAFLGYDADTSFEMKNWVVSSIIDGDLTLTDFQANSGLCNQKINEERLVYSTKMSLVFQGQMLTAEEEARIRAVARSPKALDYFGLYTSIDEAQRLAYLERVRSGEFTVETFTEDGFGEHTIKFALLDDLANLYAPGGPQYEQLAEIDADDPDYVENYVRAAFGMPQGNNDLVDSIVGQIEEDREGNAALSVVPVMFDSDAADPVPQLMFKIDGSNRHVDMLGRSWKDLDHWADDTKQQGWIYVTAKKDADGVPQFVSPQSGEPYDYHAKLSKEYPDTFMEKHGGKIVFGAYVIGGVLVIIGTGGSGALLYTGLIVSGTAGAYETSNAIDNMRGHVGSGGSYTDREGFEYMLEAAGGASGMFSAGTGALTFRAGKSSAFKATEKLAKINARRKTLQAVATSGAVFDFGLIGVNVGYQTAMVIDSDLPWSEKRKAISQIALLQGAQVALPLAVGKVVQGSVETSDFTDRVLVHDPDITNIDLQQATIFGAETPKQIAALAKLHRSGHLDADTAKKVLAFPEDKIVDYSAALSSPGLADATKQNFIDNPSELDKLLAPIDGIDLPVADVASARIYNFTDAEIAAAARKIDKSTDIVDVLWQKRAESSATYRPNFDGHVRDLEMNGESQYRTVKRTYGFVGGHNEVKFREALANPNGDNTNPTEIDKAAKIFSEEPIIDADGLRIGTEIRYVLPKRDMGGKTVLDDDGNVLYKGEGLETDLEDMPVKSVYDPSVISDEAMVKKLKRIGVEQLREHYDDLRINPQKYKEDPLIIPDNGVDYAVYLKVKDGVPYVDNVYIQKELDDD